MTKLAALRAEYGTLEGCTDREAVQALVTHPIIREGLELRLAFHAIASLTEAEERLGEVLLLLDVREFTESVAAYVARAVRLFLWGLDEECVVMCGASLEAAYHECFPDPEISQQHIRKGRWSFEPAQYERAAVARCVYSHDERELARRIFLARNGIVHRQAETDISAKDALAGTIALLAQLLAQS